MILSTLLSLIISTGNGYPAEERPTIQGKRFSGVIEYIAFKFRLLRTINWHFEGGTWNDDVDKWMARKHRLLIRLESHLAAGASESRVIGLLGPPDQTAHKGDALFKMIRRLPEFKESARGPYALLIYYWRGSHDFLYFITRGETILASAWWHAED